MILPASRSLASILDGLRCVSLQYGHDSVGKQRVEDAIAYLELMAGSHVYSSPNLKTWCSRHDYMDEGECPQCAASPCENCQAEGPTENWGGTHDQVSIARNPRLIQRWCRRCILTEQIAHWRKLVPLLAVAERELAAMGDGK